MCVRVEKYLKEVWLIIKRIQICITMCSLVMSLFSRDFPNIHFLTECLQYLAICSARILDSRASVASYTYFRLLVKIIRVTAIHD